MGDGSRKGDSKSVCPATLGGLPRPSGHLLSGRDNSELIHGRRNRVTTRNLTIATWNVLTLLDAEHSERPHIRTALIARELDKHGVDIAALTESRLSKAGSFTEEWGGYTYFWKGFPADQPRIHGVAMTVRTSLRRCGGFSVISQ